MWQNSWCATTASSPNVWGYSTFVWQFDYISLITVGFLISPAGTSAPSVEYTVVEEGEN